MTYLGVFPLNQHNLRGNIHKNGIFEKTLYRLTNDSPILLVFKMDSIIPQLFTVVELWAIMFKQWCQKPGVQKLLKMVKNGLQKWGIRIFKFYIIEKQRH